MRDAQLSPDSPDSSELPLRGSQTEQESWGADDMKGHSLASRGADQISENVYGGRWRQLPTEIATLEAASRNKPFARWSYWSLRKSCGEKKGRFRSDIDTFFNEPGKQRLNYVKEMEWCDLVMVISYQFYHMILPRKDISNIDVQHCITESSHLIPIYSQTKTIWKSILPFPPLNRKICSFNMSDLFSFWFIYFSFVAGKETFVFVDLTEIDNFCIGL